MTGTTPYDHDPKPLYYRCQAEQAGTFTWTCLEHGPEVCNLSINAHLLLFKACDGGVDNLGS